MVPKLQETNDLEWKLENRTIIDDNNTPLTVTLYKIKLKENTKVWQCFHNREEVMGARYPSAQWRDKLVKLIVLKDLQDC